MAEDALGIEVEDPNHLDLDAVEEAKRVAQEASWPEDVESAYQRLRQEPSPPR